jgi:hypothetical protein
MEAIPARAVFAVRRISFTAKYRRPFDMLAAEAKQQNVPVALHVSFPVRLCPRKVDPF